jgi:hypothetical protein
MQVLDRAIGRTIVNHNDFTSWNGLFGNALQSLINPLFGVITGDNN